MTKTKFKIRIDEPCQVPKGRLSEVELGYYCSLCSKCVVDYRQYSDQQIARAFNKEPGKERCGIFTHDQLQKVYQEKATKKYGIFSSLLLSGLLLATRNGYTQSEIAITDTVITAQSDTIVSAKDSLEVEEKETIEVKNEVKVEEKTELKWISLAPLIVKGSGTVGFMQMEIEPEEMRTPFQSIFDSTKNTLAGIFVFFSSRIPKPIVPKTPRHNNDRPIWLQSLRHRFRGENKN